MARRSGLRARILNLEERLKRRPMPRLVFSIRGAEDADIVGMASGKDKVLRLADENVTDLKSRAFELTGAVTLAALLSPEARHKLAERANERPPTFAAPSPPIEPDAAPSPTPWPQYLAGVGRDARTMSRAELEAGGWLPQPAG